MSTTSKVSCQGCGRTYRWQPNLAGKKVRCKCNAMFVMPSSDPAAKSTATDLALDDMDLKLDLSSVMESEKKANVDPTSGTSEIDSAYDLAGSEPATPVNKTSPGVTAGAGSPTKCPSCNAKVGTGAVICIACGYNLKEGRKLSTETGGVAREISAPSGKRRSVDTAPRGGFFFRLSRGWEFAKISYGIIWDFKQLIVFPILSTLSAILIILSFVLPLWATGSYHRFTEFLDNAGNNHDPVVYLTAFAFYYVNFFIIVFFNTALTACAMKVTQGEVPTVKYGLSVAVKRLPQIAAWALLSAIVGVVLKIIENTHEKIGKIVAALLGSAWTILTYFVVPVLAVEGVGPFKALKLSMTTLKETWGEGLSGNFALGLLSFLFALPIYLLLFLGIYLSASSGNTVVAVAIIGVALLVFLIHAAADSAASGVFRALLYNYATGRSMPADLDEDLFATAFGSR